MAVTGTEANALPRQQKWKQVKTRHFMIIYPERLRDAVQQVAEMTESAHQEMSRFFGIDEESNGRKNDRTRVLLTDHRDSFDRFTFKASQNVDEDIITLHVGDSTAGAPAFNLPGQDWLAAQFVYQYADILREAANSRFRSAFGMAFPDSGFAGWMNGGMALYMLTSLPGVPDRTPALDMFLRTNVLEGSIDDLKQWAIAGSDLWPGDLGMYLYGYSFLRYLSDHYGAERLKAFHQAQSKRIPHPFAKDLFKEVYGKAFDMLQAEWKQQTLTFYQSQLHQIQGRPLTLSQPLTESGYFTGSPVLSPDGTILYYIEESPHGTQALMQLHLAGRQKTRIAEGNFSGSFSLSADGQQLYFSKSDVYKTYYDVSDLYRLDLNTRKIERLTKGARAFDPAISPDGQTVVYVASRNGNMHVQSLELSSGKTTRLLSLAERTQIRHPAFSPDGSRLAFQMVNRDGRQDISLMNRDGSQFRVITEGDSINASPCWGPNARWLFFNSDRSGVPNIFAYSIKDGRLYQVTNVLTGAFDPIVSRDGRSLFFTHYSSAGMDIHQTGLFSQEWAEVQIETLQQAAWETTERLSSAETSDETRYRAFSTLMPGPTPEFGEDEDGLQAGLNLSGEDPLELHAYSLSLLYGFSSNRLEIDGEYINSQFFPTVRLYGFDRSDPYADLFRDTKGEKTDYWERRQGGGIEVGVPLYRSNRTDFYLAGGYEFQKLTSLMKADELQAPLPDEGDLANLSTRMILKSFHRHRHSISPESGFLSSIRYRRYDEAVGSDYTIDEVSGDLNLYLTMPFLQHHVLALRGAGGVSRGDTLEQGVFQVGGYLVDSETDLVYEPKFFLRGYQENAFAGDRFVLGTAEYRFPIWRPRHSAFNGALFWKNLAGTLFFETGHAWKDATEEMDLKFSAGGELALDIAYLYGRIPFGFNIGIAHGFDENDGETQAYFRFTLENER